MQNAISEEMVENPLLEEYSSGNSQSETDNSEYIASNIESQNRETKSEDFDEKLYGSQEDNFDWSKYVTHLIILREKGSGMSTFDGEEGPIMKFRIRFNRFSRSSHASVKDGSSE